MATFQFIGELVRVISQHQLHHQTRGQAEANQRQAHLQYRATEAISTHDPAPRAQGQPQQIEEPNGPVNRWIPPFAQARQVHPLPQMSVPHRERWAG